MKEKLLYCPIDQSSSLVQYHWYSRCWRRCGDQTFWALNLFQNAYSLCWYHKLIGNIVKKAKTRLIGITSWGFARLDNWAVFVLYCFVEQDLRGEHRRDCSFIELRKLGGLWISAKNKGEPNRRKATLRMKRDTKAVTYIAKRNVTYTVASQSWFANSMKHKWAETTHSLIKATGWDHCYITYLECKMGDIHQRLQRYRVYWQMYWCHT